MPWLSEDFNIHTYSWHQHACQRNCIFLDKYRFTVFSTNTGVGALCARSLFFTPLYHGLTKPEAISLWYYEAAFSLETMTQIYIDRAGNQQKVLQSEVSRGELWNRNGWSLNTDTKYCSSLSLMFKNSRETKPHKRKRESSTLSSVKCWSWETGRQGWSFCPLTMLWSALPLCWISDRLSR